MGQAATSIGAAAIKEGQRCFDVPLDTTMQNVRVPGGSMSEPEKFYALGLGSGADGLDATCAHPKALPMGSVHSAGSSAPPLAPMGTQAYPRHGDTPATPMRTEQMPPSRLPSQQAQSFPHSDPFYEGSVTEGYVEEPPSARDLDDMRDWTSQEALPTTPSLPMPGGHTQSSPLMPPPPPPPRANSGPNGMPRHTQQGPSPVHLQAPPPVAAQQTGSEEAQRNIWTQGSVLEIFSASGNRWYPALLLKVMKGDGTPDVLTMQFWLNTDEAKQKSLYRNDVQQLALLGTHLGGELPPGFCLKPSASRPGQSVYLDQTTGMKYQTAELAWQTYFKRLLERPAAGMDTVCQLPGAQSMAVSNNYGQPHQQQDATHAAAGLHTEYEAPHHNGITTEYHHGQGGAAMQQQRQQQQHQMQQHQRPHEGSRMAPPQQSASNGATISRVPLPNSGQLKATAETRHGAQLAAELNRHPPGHGAPEGPDFRRAIRA